ncbi:hypothetical protein QAD02_006750 [Eretmocerus hayati]|uniref:Uncharacterized protein n=1 Tax=Eretmocerus hayati TaxID=131215 RepID=A0ACC2N2W3_9HYME|nr:hypothetical protein QAD02_006750 [Eretmocerus hayati]
MNEMVIMPIGKRLYIDGFVYEINHLDHNGQVHWQCVRHRQEYKDGMICDAKVVTSDPSISEYITLFEGLEESKHNHRPSLADREEAEELEAMDTWKKKSEILSIDRDDPDYEPDSDTESSLNGCKPQMTESLEVSDEEMDIDEPNLDEFESSISQRSKQKSSRVGRHSCVIALDYSSSPIPPRIIGNKLNIDQFVYKQVGARNYSSRIYWRCIRYRSGECNSTAITSNPFANQGLIILKGPKESEHDHPPIHLDVQEAEEAAKFGRKKTGPKPKIIGKSVSETTPTVAKSSTCHSVVLETFLEDQKIHDVEEIHEPTTDGIIFASADSSDDQVSSAPRLIGRRLCLDGYIYSKSGPSNNDGRMYWACIRYHNYQCQGRAITSKPSEDKELTVYNRPALLKHNHPPSEDEIRKSEQIAMFGRKRARSSRSIVHTSGAFGDSNRYPFGTASNFVNSEVTAMENISEHGLGKRDEESNPQSFDGSSDSSPVRLIGKRLYIDGYIYSPRTYNNTAIIWACVRYQNTDVKCSAIATTSNYLKGGELTVRRGPEQSKHNHPPSLAELEDAKTAEKCPSYRPSKRSKFESKFDTQTAIQTPNLAHGLAKSCKSNLIRSLNDVPESERSVPPKKHNEIPSPSKGRKKGSDLLAHYLHVQKFSFEIFEKSSL